jgi:hypothetical protein
MCPMIRAHHVTGQSPPASPCPDRVGAPPAPPGSRRGPGGMSGCPMRSIAKYGIAARELAWQFVFPATRISVDPWSDVRRLYNLEESAVLIG